MLELPGGARIEADNGQHILIGYSECLRLMQAIDLQPEQLMLRKPDDAPCRWQRPGLPRLPAPLDALVGIACASGWTLGERAVLARACAGDCRAFAAQRRLP